MTIVTEFFRQHVVRDDKNFEQTFDEKNYDHCIRFLLPENGQKPNEFAKTHSHIGFYGVIKLGFRGFSLPSKGLNWAKIGSNTGKDLRLLTPVNSGFEEAQYGQESPEKYF
jgi:hypothetical protein